MVEDVKLLNMHYYAYSTEERVLQDFLVLLKEDLRITRHLRINIFTVVIYVISHNLILLSYP